MSSTSAVPAAVVLPSVHTRESCVECHVIAVLQCVCLPLDLLTVFYEQDVLVLGALIFIVVTALFGINSIFGVNVRFILYWDGHFCYILSVCMECHPLFFNSQSV